MIVNNSTNINKTNIHIPSQTLNTVKTMTYGVGNTGPGLGQAQKCGRVKPLINFVDLIYICDLGWAWTNLKSTWPTETVILFGWQSLKALLYCSETAKGFEIWYECSLDCPLINVCYFLLIGNPRWPPPQYIV